MSLAEQQPLTLEQEAQLRLACLRMAVENGDVRDVVERAERFAQFVLGAGQQEAGADA